MFRIGCPPYAVQGSIQNAIFFIEMQDSLGRALGFSRE
jgi:hypothetical protein